MKRFWLVLLSLGLVLAFSASAMAVDVKFSGSFYAAGMYLDQTGFNKDPAQYVAGYTSTFSPIYATHNPGNSTAFYYQRLRVGTEFIVSPGLKLVTRFDAMERIWGGARSAPGSTGDMASSGTRAENENIAFDLAYISYTSPIGMFNVGYQDDGAWGTPFADSTVPLAKISWYGQFGPVTTIAYLAKFKDQSYSAVAASTATDRDIDMYAAAAVYSFKDGSAGLLGKYYRSALPRSGAYPGGAFVQNVVVLVPYAKAKIGPVFVQAEVLYGFGDYQKFETGASGTNSTLSNWAGWVDATVDLGMFYFGGSLAYIAGDDPATTDKKEGGFITGGTDWNPCLIMFNFDRYYWAGQIPGYNPTANPNTTDNPYLASNNGGMTNAWFGSGRVGVRPIAPLDIMASLSYAQADQKPTGVLNSTYGWEIDVTGTYKLTNNLSYMLGVGYWFTGDYYKGTSDANSVSNNYILINKLTLTF
jgi:hypothetical protein